MSSEKNYEVIMDKNVTFTRNDTNTDWSNTAVSGYYKQMSNTEIAESTKLLFANLSTSQELSKKRTKNKRKALIVGIDKYLIPGANLSGCVNDAKDMANTLLILGFPPTQIKILTNEKATKARIIKGLEWLVKDAKPGDVLVYYHSGHGSQKTDLDADEGEGDNIDEMVIPHDFDWSDESTHLIDDDFYKALTGKTPEGVRAEAIFDTCYSGTGTRSLFRAFSGSSQTQRTARFLPRPVDQSARINTMIPAETKTNRMGEKVIEKTQHNIMWPACGPEQVSWELAINGDEIRGAFTYTFCQILRRCNGNKTRRNIYQILRTAMAEEGYEQTPGLEVAADISYEQYPFRRSIEDDPTEVAEE